MRFNRLKRREFVMLLGGAAAWPLAAQAQPTRVARIGYVSGTGSAADPGPFVEALQQGMREHGYVDGKDFIVEYRGAEGRIARVPEFVAELVQAKVDVRHTYSDCNPRGQTGDRYDSDCHGDV
jgi:putative tryptophan/tyrosine transport system substrate-binding protein